jgi:hypothetical protein
MPFAGAGSMLCLARKSGAAFTRVSPLSAAVVGSMPNRPDFDWGGLEQDSVNLSQSSAPAQKFPSLGDWRIAPEVRGSEPTGAE